MFFFLLYTIYKERIVITMITCRKRYNILDVLFYAKITHFVII